MGKKQNLILVTLDAVRPDHFSCYGYDRFVSSAIDEIADAGTMFETCICSSCLTPISHATILTGTHPRKHGMRHPFAKINRRLLSEILKEQGYSTAGFVGINFLSSQHGFAEGFDYFNEPTVESSWNTKEYKKEDEAMKTLWGNWWIPDMLNWIETHKDEPFFIWAHYFEVHFLSEKWLLASGEIPSGELSDWAYYDAKLKYMDTNFLAPMNQKLKSLGLWNDTTIAVTSDHGETLGPNQPTWEDFYINYPQHKTMKESDLKVPFVIKGKNVPVNKKITQTVSAVDMVPTILEILEIDSNDRFDGMSLVPLLRDEQLPEKITYSEELYEERGHGALQCIRSNDYKLIRNITMGTLKFYDLGDDPDENHNLIGNLNQEQDEIYNQFLTVLDEHIEDFGREDSEFSSDESKKIEDRLRDLGYI